MASFSANITTEQLEDPKLVAVHEYQGSNQAALWRNSDFGWDLFDPQPSWRTDSQAQAVWSDGYGRIVVHDSISTNRFMHYDGYSWSNVLGFLPDAWVCEALGGMSMSELWAGGDGYVGFYDGYSWTEALGPLDELVPVYSIWSKRSEMITKTWVVGGSAGNEGVYYYDGYSWTNFYSDIELVDEYVGVPMAVWGSYLADDVWVAFDLCDNPTVSGRVAHYNGVSWSIIGGVLDEGQQVLWGLTFTANELWSAGDDSAGIAPIVVGWNGSTWDNKLTGDYVARRMLGLQSGLSNGVYLATGTGATSNGAVYRRWDRSGLDGEHVWLSDQVIPRQWRDLAVLEDAPVQPYFYMEIEEGYGLGYETAFDGYFLPPFENSTVTFSDADGWQGYDIEIIKDSYWDLGRITMDITIDAYNNPVNLEPEPGSFDRSRDSVVRFRLRKTP